MPPIGSSDFPYPLRTVGGEVEVVADTVVTEELTVTGAAAFQDIYVAGTANITGGIVDLANITADSMTVLNATNLDTLNATGLSTLAGVNAQAVSATSLSSTGTITGASLAVTTPVPETSGGTGSTSLATVTVGNATNATNTTNVSGGATGQVVVQTATGTTGFVGPGTSGQVLTSTGGVPSYASIPATNLAVGVTGTLGVTNGGTGQTSLAAVTVGNATNAVTATNLASGSTGSLPVQTAAGVTGFIDGGTAGYVLTANGAGVAPSYQSAAFGGVLPVANGGTGQTSLAAVQVGTASVAVNINNGLTGQVPYQTGVSTTGFIPLQTAGTILTSNGVGVQPTFQTPQVGTVGGVLPVANGGTGVTTSTGTGSTVLSNNANLVLPNIGAASGASLSLTGNVPTTLPTNGTLVVTGTGGIGVGGTVYAGASLDTDGALFSNQAIVSASNNATSGVTGAIQVPNGGIGCGQTVWGGNLVSGNSVQGVRASVSTTDDATSTITGAITAVNGGISCGKSMWAGEKITANSILDGPTAGDPFSLKTEGGCLVKKSLRVVTGPINAGNANAFFKKVDASDTTQSTSTSTGAITTLGGLGVQQNANIGGTLTVGGVQVGSTSGTFTPTLVASTGGTRVVQDAYGKWINNGGIVTVSVYIRLTGAQTAMTAISNLSIGNIPTFITMSGGVPYSGFIPTGMGTCFFQRMNGLYTYNTPTNICPMFSDSLPTDIRFYQNGANPYTEIVWDDISASTKQIRVMISYMVGEV